MKVLIPKEMDEAHLYSVSAERLARGFRDIGVEAATLPLRADPAGLAEAIFTWRPDAVISFSSFYGKVELEPGRPLFEFAGARFVGWQFDHPLYVSHLVSEVMAGRLALYPSPNHLRFLAEAGWGGEGRVMLPGAEPPTLAPKPYAQRSLGLLVAATWNGVPAPVWRELADSPGRSLLQQVAERLLADEDASVVDAFVEARRDLGLEGLALDASVGELLRLAFTYVRHLDRLRVVEALAASGLPMTLVGQGWEGHLGARANVTYRADIPFAAMDDLHAEARVVMNLNAGNGGSERALGAALAGAAVVSDRSEVLQTALGAGVRRFSRVRPVEAAAVAGDLLESGEGEAVGQAGREAALAGALWRHRAEALAVALS